MKDGQGRSLENSAYISTYKKSGMGTGEIGEDSMRLKYSDVEFGEIFEK